MEERLEQIKKRIESDYQGIRNFGDMFQDIRFLYKHLEAQTDKGGAPKVVEEKERKGIRLLAEQTYSKLAVEFMVLAGYEREQVKHLSSLYARKKGFDNEDLQVIPLLESALWEARNSNFTA